MKVRVLTQLLERCQVPMNRSRAHIPLHELLDYFLTYRKGVEPLFVSNLRR
jgi:hypothetical protein